MKGEISRQDCSQALKYQVKNAGVCILKEVASQGILKGVQKLEELEIEELKSVLGNEIKPAIEKGLSCQSGNIFDEVLFLYDFQVAMADENFKIHEEKKLLESIVHSAKIVLHDLSSNSQLKETLLNSFGTVLNKVRGNQNLDKKVKAALALTQWYVNAYTIGEAIYAITKAAYEFESKLASHLNKNRPPFDASHHSKQLPQKFLSELKNSLVELLYDVFANIIYQKVINLAVAECNVASSKCIRRSKYLDQSRNIESLQKGGQAFNIAYGKLSIHDETHTLAVDYHSQEILNEDSPGGLLDIRVLSNEHDCKIELYTKDSNGNIKLLRRVGGGSKGVVKILYTEPVEGSIQPGPL